MSHATLSVVVFVLVMIVIISEKVHRAVVAVGGAVLLIILGVLDIETGDDSVPSADNELFPV